MADEEPVVFGEAVGDDSGMLRSSGLLDLIHRSAPRVDAEGRLYTSQEPKTAQVKAKIQPEIGGVVICGYDDGTTRSFELCMRTSRLGKVIAGGDPRTIEIIPGHPMTLTPRQARSLGHLLRMSRGKQLGLREHIKSYMAKHPVVADIARYAPPCAAIGAAFPGDRIGHAAAMAAGSTVMNLVDELGKHRERKKEERQKNAAARRR